jgi:predicted XRE-type DNA-binding protein
MIAAVASALVGGVLAATGVLKAVDFVALKCALGASVRGRRHTGAVSRDLGVSAEESEHLVVRAELLTQLQQTLAGRGLTQARAAMLLRVTQPRVSDLLRGRIDLFSTDSLIDMLARLDVHVRFVLNPVVTKAPPDRLLMR